MTTMAFLVATLVSNMITGQTISYFVILMTLLMNVMFANTDILIFLFFNDDT